MRRFRSIIITLLVSTIALTGSESEVSYYGTKSDGYAGKITASGKYMDPLAYSAAHKTLPFGTILRVVRKGTTRAVRVIVTDRGPFVKNRDLDLSWAAARDLNILKAGHALVTYTVIGFTSDFRTFGVRSKALLDRTK